MSGFILIGSNLLSPEQYWGETNSLKSSDNEISIITPQNITYKKPMSGYYPGTYGFENDEIGSVPQGWIDSSLGSGIIEVIRQKDQHKNVLHIQSGSTIDNHGVALLELDNLASGTVEYWIKFDNANPPAHYIYALDLREDLNIKVAIRIVANEWTYYDGSIYQSICPAEANKWYRLSVTWDMVSDTSDIYVYHADNTLAGSVIGVTNAATGTTVNRLYIAMNNAVINTNIWVDAVGVSWDPNYNLGNNMQEGLMLSFDNSTTLDWMGYSLDGLANKTILGNTTLPLPVNGTHHIQVFGNNSLGTMYASNLRYFTINITNFIDIFTPENKLYTEPMNGYYPATYGFENDENGIIPAEWSFFTSYTGFVQVVEELDGHNKVVELIDAGGGGGATIVSNTFSSQITGIIECYVYLNYPHNSGDYLMLQIHDQNPQDTIVIYWENGNLIVYDGTIPTIVGSYNAYTWYHVKIQFDCTDDWHLWIDENSVDGGNGYGFRSGTTTSITKFDMRTWSDNVFNYLDAVGYSWDPNYNVGANLYEGLLLSFDNYPDLDWKGYSLDGLANKTIMGNTTLPLPANGTHNIQVFGNDSLGTIYASNLRYFTIDVPMININTPENITYNAPMNGYYPATYGFENDKNGNNPSRWEIREGGGTCKVIESEASHSKIVELNDISDINRVYMNQTLIGIPYGTIEFWWRIDDTTKSVAISLFNGDTWVISLVMDNSIFKYWDSGWQDLGISATSDTWYHIRIDFECTTGGYEGLAQYYYDIYIDGTFYGDYNFILSESQIDLIHFNTNIGYNNYNAYIDAIGYSWDPYYNVGDNLNEGLLLRFMNRTNLDWMGYSLDGLVNKTILGDTTLPLPANGAHNIQVFGNDSLGIKYESEIRYFSIDVPPPSISIITPSNDDFYSNIAPSFSISITAYYQITTWYTLDDGGTNITFGGSSGTINQTEWNGRGEGPVTIRFYVNDSFGGFDYAETTINKDVTDPVIAINSPSFGAEFTTMPPYFEISVVESNIDTMWYTIDGGLNNYVISQDTGYIDSGAWNSAPNGAITIRFYVRDKAGNIDYEDVIIQKNAPPYIPPDNSLIIIISVAIGVFIAAGAILLVVFLIRKRRARPPKPLKPPKPPKPAKPPRPEIKVPVKQAKRVVPPSHVIVQREVIVIEKKPSERGPLDRETERRTRLEKEKERKQVKCLYCGTYIDDDAQFCHKCGNEQL
ncbi:MAG: zinc ribbon domain-containing protein [Promethearchaeota archaeon]